MINVRPTESRGESPADSKQDMPRTLAGQRAAVILYSGYPGDPRPRRAAEAMAAAGMEVDLLCIMRSVELPLKADIAGVHVFRLPLKHRRDSKWNYLWQYSRFIFKAFWFLTWRGWRRKYDVVHVHNMPDVLVFSALLPKLRGARIILDLHDPMPELMMSIYGLGAHHNLVRLLRVFERWSIRFADTVLTPNLAFKKLFVSRGCPPDKMQIVMNSPEPEIFDPEKQVSNVRPDGAFRIIHHGSIVHRHGIDQLVEAVALVRKNIPGICLDFYGPQTPFVETIMEVAQKLGVTDIVHFRGPAPQKVIAQAIHNADLGIIPNRRSSFTELNFPTRIFEYLAMHRPLIAPATHGIKDYFKPDELLMFEPNNVEDLAAKILWVYENPDAVADYVARGRQVYLKNLWPDEKRRFLGYVAGTASTR